MLLRQNAMFTQRYKDELHRKCESKSFCDDYKRCNWEQEFSTIQLNEQAVSWVRSRGQKQSGSEAQRARERRRNGVRESWLNSQIKEEPVRDVLIHQKFQTPTHGFSSGLSEKPDELTELMSWGREWRSPPPIPISHHNHFHHLRRMSPHAVSSAQLVRQKQLINLQNKGGCGGLNIMSCCRTSL